MTTRQSNETTGRLQLSVIDGQMMIAGECDLAHTDSIEAWLSRFAGLCNELDLSGVTFFDSATLRTLLTVRARNESFRIVNPSPVVLRVLTTTGTAGCLMDGDASGER